MNRDPVIIALDFDSARQADRLVDALGDSAHFYKVGMELYAVAGMDYVRSLAGRGKRVRSRGAATGDQKRVATPAEAVRDGADYIVVGREISRAADPAAALAAIQEQLAPAVV